ncbi:integrase catalytic domain-containing protein [Trichonephila clavipes]|nr:integrase catalytic domain-containing protein [Trichonephila clavipes]
MIAWQVRMKNIMKTDALGQKDNHSLVTSSSSSLRLPKIQFQQFSGELTDWLRFHNQFKRIHVDESIDDGDKFQYLIQTTTPKSRARDIVESFPATPENYRKAFENAVRTRGCLDSSLCERTFKACFTEHRSQENEFVFAV